jgi:hypothetical protein
MSGRVTSIDAVHDNPEVIYVGNSLWRALEIYFWGNKVGPYF